MEGLFLKFDRDEYLEEVAKKHLMTDEFLEKQLAINVLSNVIGALALSISYIAFDMSFTELCISFIVIYILYDIIGAFVDKLVCRYYDSCLEKEDLALEKKYKEADEKDREELLNKLKKEKFSYECHSGKVFKIKGKILERRLNKIYAISQEEEELKRKAEMTPEDVFMEKDMEILERVKQSFKNAKANKKRFPLELRDMYEDILSDGKAIIKIAEERPNVADRLSRTYNVYMAELVHIMQAYESFEHEEDNPEYQMIKSILEDFMEHMKDLRASIQQEGKMDFDISTQLLKESLQKNEKEEKGEDYV